MKWKLGICVVYRVLEENKVVASLAVDASQKAAPICSPICRTYFESHGFMLLRLHVVSKDFRRDP